MSKYQNILLIQTAFLGDAILTTPLIRAIKQTFPQASLDILVIPETRIIFKFNPHLNQILSFDKRKLPQRIISFFKVLTMLRRNKYDLIISGQLSFTTSVLMYLSGTKNRLGFPRQKLLTMNINLPKGLPIVQRYLKLMTALTETKFSYQTELFWNETIEDNVDTIIQENISKNKKVVGIAPGSVWKTKRWLPEYYSELISALGKKGIQTVLIGGREDYQLCQSIANKSRSKPLNLAGKLSIPGSAALIKRLDLVVTNDSAPMHLANAVQTDVIAIFGPTVRRFGFFPFREHDKVLEIGLDCRPCGKHGGNKCPQKHFNCMKAITPDIVIKAVLENLELL